MIFFLDVITGGYERYFKHHWKPREIILQCYSTYCLVRKPEKPQVRNTTRHSENIMKVPSVTKLANKTKLIYILEIMEYAFFPK